MSEIFGVLFQALKIQKNEGLTNVKLSFFFTGNEHCYSANISENAFSAISTVRSWVSQFRMCSRAF
ncbi:MAG: hypothetical protein EA358_00505 [Flavobacteriales bacterium]|nr:MAG: hypothetical protein EA358_00505 [Flavobacteriales bacterium]